jgi:RNA polymerase sigma-70 factor (ECF subfamily)
MFGDTNSKLDCDLMRRMASRDAAALGTFYESYNRLAFSLVLRIVGNRSDAEDVLVDVFWQVWQEASKYDTSMGEPVAWLLTIARTRALSALRSGNRQKSNNEISQEVLMGLSAEQRVPLEMAYFKGMSHAEIASTLMLPAETVKARIRSGMCHLREKLKAHLSLSSTNATGGL